MFTDDENPLLAKLEDLSTPSKLPQADLFGGKEDLSSSSFPAVQVGNEVTLIRRPDELCFGAIGSNRVCTALATDCSCASHRAKKFQTPVVGSFMLINGPIQKKQKLPSAFASPYLFADCLDEDLISHLLSLDSRDGSEFGSIFALIDSQEILDLSEFREKSNPAKTIRKKVREHNTPDKVAKRQKIKNALLEIQGYKDTFASEWAIASQADHISKLEENKKIDEAYKKQLEEIFSNQNKALDKLSKALVVAMQSIHLHTHLRSDEVADLHEMAEALSGMISEIKGTVGKRSVDQANRGDPSIWGHIGNVDDRIDVMEKTVGLVIDKVKEVLTNVEDLGSRCDSLETTVSRLTSDSDGSGSVDGDVVMEENDLFGRGGKNTRNAAQGNERIRGGILYPRNSKERGGSSAGGFGGGGPPSGGGGGSGSNEGDGDSRVSSLERRVEVLEERVDRIEGNSSSKSASGVEAITIEGLTFYKHSDLDAFLEQELGVGTDIKFGCFVNPYSMCDGIFRRLHSQEKVPADLTHILKLGLRLVETNDYLSIMHTVSLPKLFCAKDRLSTHTYNTRSSKTPDPRFVTMPSALDYGVEGGENSLYQSILREIRQEVKERTENISHWMSQSSKLHIMAVNLLTRTQHFLEELFAFMSQTFLSLKETFQNDEAQAWDCVCKSVEDLWRSNFLPAKANMATADVTNAHHLAVSHIWASLKMDKVACNLTATKLAAHPDVSNSYIRFLLKHLGSKESAASKVQDEKISKLTKDNNEKDKTINTMKGQITSVESRVDKLTNMVNELKKKK